MPSKNQEKISTEKKELIAQNLADFFFNFWEKRNYKFNKKTTEIITEEIPNITLKHNTRIIDNDKIGIKQYKYG